jgi:hypothetical protein
MITKITKEHAVLIGKLAEVTPAKITQALFNNGLIGDFGIKACSLTAISAEVAGDGSKFVSGTFSIFGIVDEDDKHDWNDGKDYYEGEIFVSIFENKMVADFIGNSVGCSQEYYAINSIGFTF